MSPLDQLKESSFNMLEAYKAFRDQIDSLSNQRWLGSDNEAIELAPMAGSPEALEPEEDELDVYGEEKPEEFEDWDSDCVEDLPGRLFFSLEDLNAESNSFYNGMVIGIPKDVAVRNSPAQGFMFPVYKGE